MVTAIVLADGGTLNLPQDRVPAVLVVEDEFQIRIAICSYFQDCGFEVRATATADEAVTMLENGVENIDLIFSDIRMPGRFDGLQLARWVYQHRPSVPVFLTTGDVDLVNAGYTLGASQTFFAKPYDPELVVAKIRDALKCQQLSMR